VEDYSISLLYLEGIYICIADRCLATTVIWLIGSPSPLYRYSIAAYIGAALVAHFSSPAHLEVPLADSDRINSFLQIHGLEFVASEQSWLPHFPKFFLFPHTCVRLKRKGPNLLVEGPYQFLQEIRIWLVDPLDYGDGKLR
jgi:hypothetical protein